MFRKMFMFVTLLFIISLSGCNKAISSNSPILTWIPGKYELSHMIFDRSEYSNLFKLKYIKVRDELFLKYHCSNLDDDIKRYENKFDTYKEKKSFIVGVEFQVEHEFYTSSDETKNITIVFKTNDANSINEIEERKKFFDDFFSRFDYIYLKTCNDTLGDGCISYDGNTGNVNKHKSYNEIYETRTGFFGSYAFFTIEGKLCDFLTNNQILETCSGNKYIDQFDDTLANYTLFDTSFCPDMTVSEFDDFLISLYEIKDEPNPYLKPIRQ